MLKSVRPLLWTKEIRETISFYTEVLHFNCVNSDESAGWAILARDEVEFMVCPPNAHFPFDKPNFTGSFYINTTQVDKLWSEFKDHASVCYPIETFSYGMREFALFDNNGFILQFGEERPDSDVIP